MLFLDHIWHPPVLSPLNYLDYRSEYKYYLASPVALNFINSVMETADKNFYLKCDPNHRLFEKLWDILKDCAQPTCLPDKPAGGWGKGEVQKLDRMFRPYKKKHGTIR